MPDNHQVLSCFFDFFSDEFGGIVRRKSFVQNKRGGLLQSGTEKFSGLKRSCFAAVPDGADGKMKPFDKLCCSLGLPVSFFGQRPVSILLFRKGRRMLNQI